MSELRPYQLEAVKDIWHKKRVLVADDMSLGKTAEAIAAKTLIENRQGYDRNTLVVCPASVAEHWENQVKTWYKKKEYSKVARVQTTTFDADLKRAEGADFTVVGYPTLSYLGDQAPQIDKLRKIGFQYGIIDEAHNARNPASIRSMAIKRLFDSMDYLAILSGTPLPNGVVDIYMLLSLLDKDSFPVNSENPRAILNSFYTLFRRDPEFVRQVLNDRMLRRTVDDYLQAKFPALRQTNLEVRLDGEHKEAYVQVYQNDDIKPTLKLIQLLKASVDPNLVHPDLLGKKLASRIGRMDSSVYEALDDLVQKVVDDNGKVLVFSDLKEGVTAKLKDRYQRYGAVVIDGDVSAISSGHELSLREEIRRKFQRDPDCKVLIATTVMDEGVDLTAATDVVHLTLPYMPATIDQRNRRAQRIGEVAKDYVNVHTVMPSIDALTPVITEGVQRLLDDKRRIITYIMQQPFALTHEDIQEIKNGGLEKSRHLAPFISSPVKSIFSHFGQLKGQGFGNIASHYRKFPEEAEYLARLYAAHWEGYYGGNTATLYARVIKILEEKEDLERKLDIASGPFSLSRRTGVPVTNLDLNEYMLHAGRILEREGKAASGNVAVQGAFHQLPFGNCSFDLAVISLALHMSRIKLNYKGAEINERELALREANRVLRNGGYALITLPYTVIGETDLPNFYRGLGLLGFDVLPFSGFYKGPDDSKFNVYIAGLKKTEKPTEQSLGDKYLTWRMDAQVGKTRKVSGRKRKQFMPDTKEIKPEMVSEFFHARRKKSLEQAVRGAI